MLQFEITSGEIAYAKLLWLTPRNDALLPAVIANRETRAMKQSGFAQNLTAKGISGFHFNVSGQQ